MRHVLPRSLLGQMLLAVALALLVAQTVSAVLPRALASDVAMRATLTVDPPLRSGNGFFASVLVRRQAGGAAYYATLRARHSADPLLIISRRRHSTTDVKLGLGLPSTSSNR